VVSEGSGDRRRRRIPRLDWDRLVLVAFVSLEVVVTIALLAAVVAIATR